MSEENQNEMHETRLLPPAGIWEAGKKGAQEAVTAAAKYLPAAGELASKSLYAGCYAVAFGATFGALAAGRFLPFSQLVARALQEGAQAAKSRFEPKAQQPETTEPAVAPQGEAA